MALGYEGYIKLGGLYVLGTGTSVPRDRPRIDSSSGYGGAIKENDPTGALESEIGIGTPHNYDWLMYDGSVSFEVSRDVWADVLWEWPFDRQSSKELLFASRKDNVQQFDEIFFNSIQLSAAEDGAVDGSLGFVSIQRNTYTFGSSYIDNKFGDGLLCPLDPDMPKPLNADLDQSPVPYWNTRVLVDSVQWDFLDWSLNISQPVEVFYGCTHSGGADPGVQEPLFLACGPMQITLSGTIMENVLIDAPTQIEIFIDDKSIIMKRIERQSSDDDVQNGDGLVIQNVEFEAFEIAKT